MTPDEIRKVRIAGALAIPSEGQISLFQCAMLQELTAQVAALNANLSTFSKSVGDKSIFEYVFGK